MTKVLVIGRHKDTLSFALFSAKPPFFVLSTSGSLLLARYRNDAPQKSASVVLEFSLDGGGAPIAAMFSTRCARRLVSVKTTLAPVR